MPLANIVDRRSNEYYVRCDVVFEPSCNDNSIKGASQFDEETELDVMYVDNIGIYSMIEWANKWQGPVTAFLYDVGTNHKGTNSSGEEVYVDVSEKEQT